MRIAHIGATGNVGSRIVEEALCPSAEFGPGQRTGKFRLGKDTLLTLPNGESKISIEDVPLDTDAYRVGIQGSGPSRLRHVWTLKEIVSSLR